MSELINRQMVIDALRNTKFRNDLFLDIGYKNAINIIESLPTVRTIQPERAKGKRIPFDVEYECSNCGIILNFYEGSPKANNANFCPNCGADMCDGGKDA